jgi:hypothetical protein
LIVVQQLSLLHVSPPAQDRGGTHWRLVDGVHAAIS